MNGSVAATALRVSLWLMVAFSSNATAFAQSLPPPWTANDIGASAVSGAVSYDGGFAISAAGIDISDTSDGFYFVYQPVTGDVDIVARVLSLTDTHPWAKAGVMVRESLAAESRHATVAVTSGNGYAFLRRPEAGAYSEHAYGGESAGAGWVRLVRTGDVIDAYQSSDGNAWVSIGSSAIGMGPTVYVGLAVTSRNEFWATTAVIDSVTVGRATEAWGNAPPSVSLASPGWGANFTAPGTVVLTANASDSDGIGRVEFFAGETHIATEYYEPYTVEWSNVPAGTYALTAVAYDALGASTAAAAVRVTVSDESIPPPPIDSLPGLQSIDVGWSSIGGYTVHAEGRFIINASGTDIWGASDGFHFVYQPISGDSDIVARVVSLTNTDSWAKAGVMMRESLSAESRYALVAITGANGYAFQTRSETGGYSDYMYGEEGTAPGWVRLVRRGDVFEAYRSNDAYTWTHIGSATIGMGSTVYVGLAVTSRNEWWATTAVIDSVDVRAGTWEGGGGGNNENNNEGTNDGNTTTPPRAVMFTASGDHEIVWSYLLEIFAAYADPNSATPLASSDLGRPMPDHNYDITVDQAWLFADLAPGVYLATVSAIGAEGRSRSAAVTFVR